MAIPNTLPFGGVHVKSELGLTGPYRILGSDVRGLAGKSSGPIHSNDLLGKSAAAQEIVVNTGNDRTNIAAVLAANGVTSGAVEVTVVGTHYSSAASTAAITVTNIPAAVDLTLILDSSLNAYGRGGDGGSVNAPSWSGYVAANSHSTNPSIYQMAKYVANGKIGGTALYVRSPCKIVDLGARLYGGGGGGGGIAGRLRRYSDWGVTYEGGAGGGGGSGYVGGNGGLRRNVTKTVEASTATPSTEQSTNGSPGNVNGPGAAGVTGFQAWTSIKGGSRHGFCVNDAGRVAATSQAVGAGGAIGLAGESKTLDGAFGGTRYIENNASISNLNAYAAGGARGKAIDGLSYITWVSGYDSSRYTGAVV